MSLINKIKQVYSQIDPASLSNDFYDYEHTFLVANYRTGEVYELTEKDHIPGLPEINWIKIDSDSKLSEVLEYFEFGNIYYMQQIELDYSHCSTVI